MSHVKPADISQHLHHGRMTFQYPETAIPIGVGQTVTVNGSGRGIQFDVNGTDTSDHFANAHLVVNDALGFRGDVNLGIGADVRLIGISGTSFTFRSGEFDLYSGNNIVDRLNLHTTGPIEVSSFAPSSGFDGAVHITTGRLTLAEGAFNGINQHV